MNPQGTTAELDELERAESLLLAERRSLELIAARAPLTDILAEICGAIDAQAPGIISADLYRFLYYRFMRRQ